MNVVLLALGLVLIVEGLAWVLAPSAVEQMLEMLRRLPLEARRTLGMLAVLIGVTLVWAARWIGP